MQCAQRAIGRESLHRDDAVFAHEVVPENDRVA